MVASHVTKSQMQRLDNAALSLLGAHLQRHSRAMLSTLGETGAMVNLYHENGVTPVEDCA